MKALFRFLCLLGCCIAASDALAQRETLGVLPVKVIPAVATKLSHGRKTLSAEQMSQSLMEQFINSVNATRKFQVVVRGDLKELVADDDKARLCHAVRAAREVSAPFNVHAVGSLESLTRCWNCSHDLSQAC